jgi:hypothetical protein
LDEDLLVLRLAFGEEPLLPLVEMVESLLAMRQYDE